MNQWDLPPVLSAACLGQGVRAFTTLRQGGVSRGVYGQTNLGLHVGDDPRSVQENRARLQRALPGPPLWLDQVHGAAVLDADADSGLVVPTADASVTTRCNRVLAILTADCLPVVVTNESATVLGVAHAGWRGLATGVLQNLVSSLRDRAHSQDRYVAWLGPCIGPTAFQVGTDVLETFVALHHDARQFFRPDAQVAGRWLCDLPGLAQMVLRTAGVDAVTWCGDCTVRDSRRFFSYRRDGVTGRMATLAWLAEPSQ